MLGVHCPVLSLSFQMMFLLGHVVEVALDETFQLGLGLQNTSWL